MADTLVDASAVYGIINVLSVIIPAPAILLLAKGTGIPTIRNLSLLLVGFAVIHGLYHLSFIAGIPSSAASAFDFFSVLLLIAFGVYYIKKVG